MRIAGLLLRVSAQGFSHPVTGSLEPELLVGANDRYRDAENADAERMDVRICWEPDTAVNLYEAGIDTEWWRIKGW